VYSPSDMVNILSERGFLESEVEGEREGGKEENNFEDDKRV